MMPDNFHEDDKRWIFEQLKKLPLRHRIIAASGYSSVYEAAYESEQVGQKKENKARFAANTRLRKYVVLIDKT